MSRTAPVKSTIPITFGLLFLVFCFPAAAQTGIPTARLLAANDSIRPRSTSLNLASPAATAPTLEQASDIERHAEDIIATKRRLNQIYVKHTGQPYEVIEKTLDRDYFMTADQAKEFGLIDKVIQSRDEVEGVLAAGKQS